MSSRHVAGRCESHPKIELICFCVCGTSRGAFSTAKAHPEVLKTHKQTKFHFWMSFLIFQQPPSACIRSILLNGAAMGLLHILSSPSPPHPCCSIVSSTGNLLMPAFYINKFTNSWGESIMYPATHFHHSNTVFITSRLLFLHPKVNDSHFAEKMWN